MNEVKSPSNGARGTEKVIEGAHRRNGMRSIWTRPTRTRTNRRMNEEGKGKQNMGARRRDETDMAQQQHARRPRAAPTGAEKNYHRGRRRQRRRRHHRAPRPRQRRGDSTPPPGSRRRPKRSDATRPGHTPQQVPGRTALIHKYALLLPLGGARAASPPPPARTPGRAPSRRRTGARGWRARTPRFPRDPGTPGGQGAAVMLYDTHARPGGNGHARVRSASGPRPFLQILSYAPRPVRVRSASAAVFPRGNRKVARGAGVARTPKGYTFGMSGAGMARAFPVPQGLGGGIMQDPQSHWLCGSSPALAAGVH
eukprot:gene22401-biopygen17736